MEVDEVGVCGVCYRSGVSQVACEGVVAAVMVGKGRTVPQPHPSNARRGSGRLVCCLKGRSGLTPIYDFSLPGFTRPGVRY